MPQVEDNLAAAGEVRAEGLLARTSSRQLGFRRQDTGMSMSVMTPRQYDRFLPVSLTQISRPFGCGSGRCNKPGYPGRGSDP
jgi:hypothetical protein